MATFQVRQRRFWVDPAMAEALDQYVTDPKTATPGTLLKRGAWYWLAYLKVAKVKSFELPLWELMAQEVNTIRMVSFRVQDGRLLTTGGNNEMKEIAALLDALALQVHGASDTGQYGMNPDLNYADYYKLEPVEIGLAEQLERMERAGLVSDVRSVQVADMEVKLGLVKRATIKTDDYGGVKKVLAEVGHKVRAIEVQLKAPEKTWVTLTDDGAVKVLSRATGTDCDFEDLAVRLALEASQAGAAPVAQAPKRKPRGAADAKAAAGGGA